MPTPRAEQSLAKLSAMERGSLYSYVLVALRIFRNIENRKRKPKQKGKKR